MLGIELHASPLNSNPGGGFQPPVDGLSDGEIEGYRDGPSEGRPEGKVEGTRDGSSEGWLLETTLGGRFQSPIDGFELGDSDKYPYSTSLPPSRKTEGAPVGSKLTEGIEDSHHFPRTFVISSPLTADCLKES